ncbi:hypothetical protein HDU84_001663 [Entophlyctis sp. JEL0112]|nr:hypothetical protein HDU84_001663 [Entophlyctis sp. JEL0112]
MQSTRQTAFSTSSPYPTANFEASNFSKLSADIAATKVAQSLAAALVKEYLTALGLTRTLDAYKVEHLQFQKNIISSRSELAERLGIGKLLKQNKAQDTPDHPLKTQLEIIVKHLSSRTQKEEGMPLNPSKTPNSLLHNSSTLNNRDDTMEKPSILKPPPSSVIIKSPIGEFTPPNPRSLSTSAAKTRPQTVSQASETLTDFVASARVRPSTAESVHPRNANDLQITEDFEEDVYSITSDVGNLITPQSFRSKWKSAAIGGGDESRGRGSFSEEWKGKGFSFNENASLAYGIVQVKGGPCGLLAAVQAFVLKHLLFAESANNLRFNPLLKASNQLSSHRERYLPDGITENLEVFDFFDTNLLKEFVTDKLETVGCSYKKLLLNIYCRGIEAIREEDFDEVDCSLIGRHGYCTQEMVNLILIGKAISNVHDGDFRLGEGTEVKILKGIKKRSQFGFLSLFEHYGSMKVGDYFKKPWLPIFVVCSESHFTILFAVNKETPWDNLTEADNNVYKKKQPVKFELVYYDGLANQEDEITLEITLANNADSVSAPTNSEKTLIPPLEHVLRTKWPEAKVVWRASSFFVEYRGVRIGKCLSKDFGPSQAHDFSASTSLLHSSAMDIASLLSDGEDTRDPPPQHGRQRPEASNAKELTTLLRLTIPVRPDEAIQVVTPQLKKNASAAKYEEGQVADDMAVPVKSNEKSNDPRESTFPQPDRRNSQSSNVDAQIPKTNSLNFPTQRSGQQNHLQQPLLQAQASAQPISADVFHKNHKIHGHRVKKMTNSPQPHSLQMRASAFGFATPLKRPAETMRETKVKLVGVLKMDSKRDSLLSAAAMSKLENNSQSPSCPVPFPLSSNGISKPKPLLLTSNEQPDVWKFKMNLTPDVLLTSSTTSDSTSVQFTTVQILRRPGFPAFLLENEYNLKRLLPRSFFNILQSNNVMYNFVFTFTNPEHVLFKEMAGLRKTGYVNVKEANSNEEWELHLKASRERTNFFGYLVRASDLRNFIQQRLNVFTMSRKLPLVLDLDDTLVRMVGGEEKNNVSPQLASTVPERIRTLADGRRVVLAERVEEFLQWAQRCFEISVCSVGDQSYVDMVVNVLDPQRTVIRGQAYSARSEYVYIQGSSLSKRPPKDLESLFSLPKLGGEGSFWGPFVDPLIVDDNVGMWPLDQQDSIIVVREQRNAKVWNVQLFPHVQAVLQAIHAEFFKQVDSWDRNTAGPNNLGPSSCQIYKELLRSELSRKISDPASNGLSAAVGSAVGFGGKGGNGNGSEQSLLSSSPFSSALAQSLAKIPVVADKLEGTLALPDD